MSLDTNKGKRICTCDSCGIELQDSHGKIFKFDPDEFDVFIERLQEEGWKSGKNKAGEWEHTCQDCQDD